MKTNNTFVQDPLLTSRMNVEKDAKISELTQTITDLMEKNTILLDKLESAKPKSPTIGDPSTYNVDWDKMMKAAKSNPITIAASSSHDLDKCHDYMQHRNPEEDKPVEIKEEIKESTERKRGPNPKFVAWEQDPEFQSNIEYIINEIGYIISQYTYNEATASGNLFYKDLLYAALSLLAYVRNNVNVSRMNRELIFGTDRLLAEWHLDLIKDQPTLEEKLIKYLSAFQIELIAKWEFQK